MAVTTTPVETDQGRMLLRPFHKDLAIAMKAPVIGFYGEADAGIPVATVEALKEVLAKANKPAEFKIYPGAPHGFHADYRPSYRKEAAEDAWNQMQAWFKKYKVLG